MDSKEDLTAIELENLALKNLAMGQFETALGFAQKAVEKDSSRFPSLACVCKCALALGRPRLAEDASIRAGKLARGAPEAEQLEHLVTLDQDYEEACLVKDYACVVRLMGQLLEVVPCARYRTCKAEALATLGHYEQVEEMASNDLQGVEDMADSLYIHALCLYYQECYQEAFLFFQQALQLNPNHAKAKSIYERAIRLSAAKEAGNAAYSAQRYEDALRLYSAALSVHPENRSTCAKLHFNRALAAAKMGRAADAVDDCSAALTLDPAYLKALLHRAQCHTDVGNHEEAAKDYERALKLDDSPAIREQLATAQAALHANARSQRSYKNTAAGYSAYRSGDFSLARRCYTDALDDCSMSARPHLLISRATAAAQVGEHGQAVVDLTEVLALDPTLEDALMHRAQSYTALNQLEMAVQDYQRLAEINNSKENKGLLSNAKRGLTVHKKNENIKADQNARLAARRKMEDMFKEKARLAKERSFQQATEGETFETFNTDKPFAGTGRQEKKTAKATADKKAYEKAAELARENLVIDMAAERSKAAAARHVRETAGGRAKAAKEAGNVAFVAGWMAAGRAEAAKEAGKEAVNAAFAAGWMAAGWAEVAKEAGKEAGNAAFAAGWTAAGRAKAAKEAGNAAFAAGQTAAGRAEAAKEAGNAAFAAGRTAAGQAEAAKETGKAASDARRAEVAKEAGNAAFAAGRLAEAQMLYTRAMTLDLSNHSLNAKLHFNRAAVQMRQGRLREAIIDCTQALRLDKTHLQALLRRGKCYELMKLYEAAVGDYETAVKMDGCGANHRLLAEARNAARLQKTTANEPPKALLKPQHKVNLFYEVLGISKNATTHEIKSAYRRKAQETHPDKHPHATSLEKEEHERRFKEVGQAYSVLGDPYKRLRYNRGERF